MKLQRLLLSSMMLLLAACNADKAAEVQSEDQTTPGIQQPGVDDKLSAAVDEAEIGENAIVDEVILVYPPTWPEEIEVVINGSFSDACTELDHIVQTRDGSNFNMKVKTSRQADAECTLALVPFSTKVVLDLRELADNEYQVTVYDHWVNFELDVVTDPETQGG